MDSTTVVKFKTIMVHDLLYSFIIEYTTSTPILTEPVVSPVRPVRTLSTLYVWALGRRTRDRDLLKVGIPVSLNPTCQWYSPRDSHFSWLEVSRQLRTKFTFDWVSYLMTYNQFYLNWYIIVPESLTFPEV